MKSLFLSISLIFMVVAASQLFAQPPGYYHPGMSYDRAGQGPSSFRVQRGVRFQQDQDESGYHLRIRLQGYSPESIQVSVDGRSLLVENREAHRVENRSERSYSFSTSSSSMRRRFRLPWVADLTAMQRTENEGEIVITLPYRTQ
ncbi:MAG: Hsp20/alpha crystallin family protein [gamma proteobacterium symbiont of Ctena orbiculata]